MITKNEEYVLSVALANENIASEIAARVIDATPADAAAAQAILDVIDSNEKEEKQIEEYLIVALANRKHGKEIKKQLDLVVECLGYQAADSAANNAALNAAQAEIKALSKEAKEYLVVAMANRSIAESVAAKIDAAGVAAAAIADA
jgi:threonine dehydrogenase-like Zn-dependent dehydrogenase